MPEETLRRLEFDLVVQWLAGLTQSPPGRERALVLRPLADRPAVELALAEAQEMIDLQNAGSAPAFGGLIDLLPLLTPTLLAGGRLDPLDLLAVGSALATAADCRRFFAAHSGSVHLQRYVAQIDPCKALAAQLRKSLGLRGEILDSASPLLGRLRDELRDQRQTLRRRLETLMADANLAGVFQDQLVTERGGRYVLPVKADFRGKVKGFVHDASASGQTLFVEPAVALDGNNHLHTLQRQIDQEEERILLALSSQVATAADVLRCNQQQLAHLDLRGAVARLARICDAVRPQLVDAPLLDLRQARHPLLLADAKVAARVVPIDLRLGASASVLVVSGPNTGGKTVALKTAGLLLLMLQSGLPIPCHPDSQVHLFGRIFADIGDEQSIAASRSTFSGHLLRLRQILAEADSDSLVLLDEAGTGTDPAEGAALILAALDHLRAVGARVLLTTHLNLLKGYAQLTDDVENAAVEFDPKTLLPTYRLHYGIPGESGALAIARHYGLPEAVLQRAESYLGSGEQAGRELIERLNTLVRELDAERVETARLLLEARQDRDRRRQLLQELEGQKADLLSKTLRRGEQAVQKAERDVRQLLERLPAAQQLPEKAEVVAAVKQIKRQLQQETPRKSSSRRAPHSVTAGEVLHVPGLGVDAVVLRPPVHGSIELDIQGKKLRLMADQLEQYAPRRFAGRAPAAAHIRSFVARENLQSRLLLVGQRVEAALPLLERFLDDALLHGQREIEIVHGTGEGILRRAVRELLAGHRGVSAFHAADSAQGGDNVTVVQMRDQ